MSLNANAIVDLTTAKTYLHESSSANDSTIELMINSLSADFEQAVDGPIKQQTFTDYRVSGNGEFALYLPKVPAQSVSKVDMRFRDDSVYVTLTSTSEWILRSIKVGLLELINYAFLEGERNILITMVVGYASSDYDWSNFQKHFLDQLAVNYKEWDTQGTGLTARSIEGGSLQYLPKNNFIPKVQQFLDSMRDRRFV